MSEDCRSYWYNLRELLRVPNERPVVSKNRLTVQSRQKKTCKNHPVSSFYYPRRCSRHIRKKQGVLWEAKSNNMAPGGPEKAIRDFLILFNYLDHFFTSDAHLPFQNPQHPPQTRHEVGCNRSTICYVGWVPCINCCEFLVFCKPVKPP